MNFSQKNEEASALPGLTFNIVSSIRSREARRSSRQKILLCTIIGKNDLNDFSVACPLLPPLAPALTGPAEASLH